MQNNKNKLLFSVLYLSALMSPALARADQAAATGFDILRTPPANAPVDNRVKDQSYRYADGTEYTGIWKAGVPDGEGKLKLPDGSIDLFLGHLVNEFLNLAARFDAEAKLGLLGHFLLHLLRCLHGDAPAWTFVHKPTA